MLDQPSIWPIFGPARSVSTDSSSPSSLALAASWLSRCLMEHTECQTQPGIKESEYLPSRILDLGFSEKSVSLIETRDRMKAPYAALSYCWGTTLKSGVITTTTSTLENRKQGIAITSLPLTVQHAVAIARALNLRYLWVDSLCIIQDSYADWAVESARMSEIFMNAKVTISADGASRVSEGCFIPSPHRKLAVLALPCPGIAGTTSKIYVRKSGYRHHSNGSHSTRTLGRAAIDTRAWTLQERLLAPRVLHFTSTELVWQCATEVNCECQITQIEPDRTFFRPFRHDYISKKNVYEETRSRARSSALSAPTDAPAINVSPIFNNYGFEQSGLRKATHFDWRRIVIEYTQRHLTKETDRLAAISGLAAALTRTKKLPRSIGQDWETGYETENYYFGLWKKELERNMLWHVQNETDDTLGVRQSSRLEGAYAPSWSWASITGQISYYDEVSQQDRRETKLESRMTFVKMHYTLFSENPYGPGSGELYVQGQLIPVLIRLNDDGRYTTHLPHFVSRDFEELGQAQLDVTRDDGGEIQIGEVLYWLHSADIVSLGRSSTRDQGIMPIGPLLKIVAAHRDSMPYYKRVGLVLGHRWHNKWLGVLRLVREYEHDLERAFRRRPVSHVWIEL